MENLVQHIWKCLSEIMIIHICQTMYIIQFIHHTLYSSKSQNIFHKYNSHDNQFIHVCIHHKTTLGRHNNDICKKRILPKTSHFLRESVTSPVHKIAYSFIIKSHETNNQPLHCHFVTTTINIQSQTKLIFTSAILVV